MGISLGGSIRVGNELGAGNSLRAKRASYVCIGVVGKYCYNIAGGNYIWLFAPCNCFEVGKSAHLQVLHNTTCILYYSG